MKDNEVRNGYPAKGYLISMRDKPRPIWPAAKRLLVQRPACSFRLTSNTLAHDNVYPSDIQALVMRDAAINLRALPEQRDLIDQAALVLGKNRSDFMLEAACERAEAVLLDQVFFRLDAEKFDQFVALLDAPPKPNPGLERLMAIKEPWGTNAA